MNTRSASQCLLACCLAASLTPIHAMAGEASPCGPGMSGAPKSIVHYSPGANIAGAAQLMPKHLAFLQMQMSKGAIQYAGPIVAAGAPTGRALVIYQSADSAAVQAIVQTDPMVTGKVFSYEIGTWLECSSGMGS